MIKAADEFDLLVAGGGKAAKRRALDWAESGERVAVVERGMIWASCINVVCFPTKALVAAAHSEQLGVTRLSDRVRG